jgi:hypothetical protein
MLHFEVLNAIPSKTLKYKGGNLFGSEKKESWMDPMIVLKNHK